MVSANCKYIYIFYFLFFVFTTTDTLKHAKINSFSQTYIICKCYWSLGIDVVSRDCQTMLGEVFFSPCSLSISLSFWAIHCFISYMISNSSLVCGKCLNLTGRSFDKLRQQRTCPPPTLNSVCWDPFVRNLIIFYALTFTPQASTITTSPPLPTLFRCIYIVRTDIHYLYTYIRRFLLSFDLGQRYRPLHFLSFSLYRYL
jgi:hypothetical protein